MFLLAILLGSITFGVSGSAQALNTLSRSAPVGHASKRVELPGIQDAPEFGTVDIGALALRLRASSESAILASQALDTALNTVSCADLVELADLAALADLAERADLAGLADLAE